LRLTDIRTALDELQMRPTKSLGQNFLHDQNLARAIAAAVAPDHVPCAATDFSSSKRTRASRHGCARNFPPTASKSSAPMPSTSIGARS
jgi:hypothetical protein